MDKIIVGTSITDWVSGLTSRSRSKKSRALIREGNAARSEKRWLDAIASYRAAVELDPSRADISIQLGHAAKESGLLDLAGTAYAAALKLRPEDDDLMLQIGHLEKIRGNIELASQWYRRALALNALNIDALREAEALRSKAVAGQDQRKYPRGQQAVPSADEAGAATQAVPWQDAAKAYEAKIALNPDDQIAWSRLVEVRKNSGDSQGAIQALRTQIRNNPGDAELHRRLGDFLQFLGDSHGAVSAYQDSFRLLPRRDLAVTMTALNAAPAYAGQQTRQDARPHTYVEVFDLLRVLPQYPTISGIQRVQIALVQNMIAAETAGVAFVTWADGHLWALERRDLAALIDHVERSRTFDPDHRKRLAAIAENHALLVSPGPGDLVISTGVIYFRRDIVVENSALRQAGARVGAIIYDHIPITHPEYVAKAGVLEFAASMTESLATLDFALTISTHVAIETARLLEQGGYPALPTRVLPLAHSFTKAGAAHPPIGSPAWTAGTAALRGVEYVLCVGTAYAHKNHMLLLQAWKLLLDTTANVPMLVFAGKHRSHQSDLHHQLDASEILRRHVRIVEAPTDPELELLYRNCLFTILPSFVEGWGLPVGESLSHGKVCLASNVASIPEVGGDFVLYFDPYSARDCATLVRALIEDRGRLASLERRIEEEFTPRLWSEVTDDFLAAIAEVPRDAGPERYRALLDLPADQVQRVRRLPVTDWTFGTGLPPAAQAASQIRGRTVLSEGWHPIESWGAWMAGTRAEVVFGTGAPAGTPVDVTLVFRSAPWSGNSSLIAIARDNDPVAVKVPLTAWPEHPWRWFTTLVPAIVDAHGRVMIDLRLRGPNQKSWWDERHYSVGLCALSWSPAHVTDGRPPPFPAPDCFFDCGNPWAAELEAPWPFRSEALTVLRRVQSILVDGWQQPAVAGSWIDARSATARMRVDAPEGAPVRASFVLRGAADTVSTVRIAAGDASTTVFLAGHPSRDVVVPLECRAGPEGTLAVRFDVSARPAPGSRTVPPSPWVCLVGFAYSLQAGETGQTGMVVPTIADTPQSATPRIAARTIERLVDDIGFEVVGHINGTYSLAAVNRSLAAALETTFPGRVRIEQVENGLVHDLTQLEPAERELMTVLAARPPREGGMLVTIAQHWPIWVPEQRGELSLAWVFWEESQAPVDMVDQLNRNFDGVLVQSRFVRQALIDSGVRLPIRVLSFAMDVGPFLQAGDRRQARDPVRRGTRAAPFTFLHVSSCFPRKGLDVLLKAYAAAFSRADAVRLLIKTFPNVHHDTAEEVRQLQHANPGLPAIEVICQDMDRQSVVALYEDADAVVLPTRGEGFNAPASEALAAGVPLIVTGHGGQRDFAGPDTAWQIDFAFAYSRSHLKAGPSVWVDPDPADLEAALKQLAAAHQNPADAAKVRARVARGRAAIKQMASPTAWAGALAAVAAQESHRPATVPASVAWISTWQLRCGIAEYSRHLLSHYPGHANGLPGHANDVTILHDERTSNEPGAGTHFKATPAWRVHDSGSIDGLAQAIEDSAAQVAVIQHHKGLIHWTDLATLLTDERVSRRQTVVTLHNVQEYVQGDGVAAVTAALKGATRVLVHTVNDLNLLKSHGIVDNVALFPQGAPRRHHHHPSPARALPKDAAPVIGTYGFFLPHKGFSVLIEAFAKVRRRWPDAILRMVTAEYPNAESQAEIQRCRALAKSMGLDAVEWHLEYLPSEASLALLATCDLIVLPYQETLESSSAAVRSALASGVPVAVAPIKVFDDVESAVLRLGGTDSTAIAASISTYLDDFAARSEAVEAGARWLAAHDWAATATRMEGLLTSLVLNADR